MKTSLNTQVDIVSTVRCMYAFSMYYEKMCKSGSYVSQLIQDRTAQFYNTEKTIHDGKLGTKMHYEQRSLF